MIKEGRVSGHGGEMIVHLHQKKKRNRLCVGEMENKNKKNEKHRRSKLHKRSDETTHKSNDC